MRPTHNPQNRGELAFGFTPTHCRLLSLVGIALVGLFCRNDARAAALITTNTQGAGTSWTNLIWKTNLADTVFVAPVAGNTYTAIDNGVPQSFNANVTRIRNPATDGTQQFPGTSLTVNTNAEIRFKKGAATGAFPFVTPTISHFPGVGGNPGLILNGAMLNPGDDATFPISGSIQIATDSIMGLADGGIGGVTPNRGLRITGSLSGTGALIVVQGVVTNFSNMEVTSANNSYSGNWIVKAGWLRGIGSNSLGSGDITLNPAYAVSTSLITPAAVAGLSNGPVKFEVDYNIDTPGTLTVSGDSVVVLHQNCRFAKVFVDGSPIPNGTYSYDVISNSFPTHVTTNGSGSISIGPATPTGLTAVSGDTQALLTWTGSSGATGYVVKVSLTPTGPYTVVATTGTSTSYVATGLANGTPYYYVVSALNSGGESADSNEATVTPNIVAPAITADPQNSTNCTGTTASFSATATGHFPLIYQWYNTNGVALANQTNSTLTLNNVQLAQANGYFVIVTNTGGSATSAVALLVVKIATVATGPANQTNCPGTTATFTTSASGAGTLTYTWRKGAAIVQDPNILNSSSYSIVGVTSTDSGAYSVTVVGECNTVSNAFTFVVAPPPVITAQPANQSTPLGNGALFSVTATTTNAGAAPLTYQWLTNGVILPGATASSLSFSNVTLADNGKQVSVVVSNCAGIVTSTVATLTVFPVGGISFDFNTPGQFTNVPYFTTFNDWLIGAQPNSGNGINPPNVFEVPAGGVTNSGALDLLNANGTENSIVLFAQPFDFSLQGQTLVASVMFKAKAPTANNRSTQIGFVTATNVGINDNNPQAFMTMILQSTAQPALTYDMRTQRRSDNGGVLETTGLAPATTLLAGNWYKVTATFINNKGAGLYQLIGSVQDMGANGATPGATNLSFPATNITVAAPATILNATRVYLAIRNLETTGIDFRDNAYAYSTNGPIFVTAPPASQTVPQGTNGVFKTLVDGEGPYSYQWQKSDGIGGFTNIPLAGNWKYVTAQTTLSDSGAQYRCVVTGPVNSVTTDPATLMVSAQTLALVSVGSVDGGVVGVLFNQPVDLATAQNPANYMINGSPSLGALLRTAGRPEIRTDRRTVLLTAPSLLSGSFTVTVQNVKDLSGGLIGPQNSTNGVVAGLIPLDVNNAQPPGSSLSFAPNSFDITGGGADIFGTADSFHYAYTTRSGDFDVKTRVPYLDAVAGPTKAGFEVRATLDPGSPQVLAAVNPPWPGRGFFEGTTRTNFNQVTISWGVNTSYPANTRGMPDEWLRFRRSGKSFHRYSSRDGITWLFDGQISQATIPDTYLFGLTVCAVNGNNAARPATGIFDNYGDFAGYPGAVITMATQPASSSIAAGNSVNLSAAANVTVVPAAQLNGERNYVWQRTNSAAGGWTNMPTSGLTNNTVNTGPLFIIDSPAHFRVVVQVPGALSVTSSVATITITDAAGPTLASVTVADKAFYQVSVVYNEPVGDSGTNTANYTLTNAAGVVFPITGASFLNGDRSMVILTTSSLLVAGDYGLSVSTNVRDLNNNPAAANLGRLFSTGFAPTGPVVVEIISGIANADLTALGVYTNDFRFTGGTPDFVAYTNIFAHQITFVDTGIQNYGFRVYSYFVPPSNGLYRFWMRSDDSSQLYMNTNNTPDSTNRVGRQFLGQLTGANAAYQAMTNGIQLVGGQRYYMEALVKEGGGGDGVSVAVRASADAAQPPATEAIPLSMLQYPSAVARRTPVVIEDYVGVGGADLASLGNMTNSGQYRVGNPTYVNYNSWFGRALNLSDTLNNFGSKIYSYFVPTNTGLYRFWMRSDDASRLFMNTNAVGSTNPAGRVFLGELTGFQGNYTAMAQNVPLTAGQRYYIEGIFKEGGGGDGMTVAIRPQEDPNTPPNTEFIPDSMFEYPYDLGRIGPVVLLGLTPVNPTVTAGSTVTFTLGSVSGGMASAFNFLWYQDGVLVQITTGNTFTTLPLTNTSVFTVVATNMFSRSELSSTVTVTADTIRPTLVSAGGCSSTATSFDLVFSEPVNFFDAVTLANYSVSGGVTLSSAALQADNRTVRFTSSPINTPGTKILTVNNVRDRAAIPNTILANSQINIAVLADGTIRRHFWKYASGGGTVAAVTGDPRFPNFPDSVSFPLQFEDTQIDNGNPENESFGVQFLGLLSPPVTGNYNFFISSDDNSSLWLSTDENPANKVLIANEPQWNGSRSYYVLDRRNATAPENRSTTRFPAGILLEAGRRYYIESIFSEGGGGNNMSVAWQLPGGPLPTTPIPGCALSPYNLPVTIPAGQPADVNTFEARRATFNVDVTGSPILIIRWFRDGSLIPGATNRTYTTDVLTTNDSGSTFVMVVSNSLNTVTSRVATLTVLADTNAPFMVSAGSVDGLKIGICYSEQVDPDPIGTTSDPFAYKINGQEGKVGSVLIHADGQTATLYLNEPAISGPFTVEAIGIEDRSSSGPLPNGHNSGDSMVASTVMGLTPVDIASPLPAGTNWTCTSNMVEVSAGGADVWDPSDQFTFLYTPRTNDFDVRVCVTSLPFIGNNWSKAGLNARESLDAASRMVWTYPTPVAGAGAYEGAIRQNNGGTVFDYGEPRPLVGQFPAYVRIVRSGTNFTTYTASNNVDWVQLGTNVGTVDWPEVLLVGLGTVSHIQGTPVTATFKDFHFVAPPVIVTGPANQVVFEGGTANFSVSATGDPEGGALTYQWRHAGTNLPAATNSNLSVPGATRNEAGLYEVAVRNSAGAVSAAATLTVLFSPEITQQPTNQTSGCGSSVTFTVVAVGGPPPTYQWTRNNVTIPDATNSSLTLNNLTMADAGTYRVIVANFLGMVTSDPAVLTVVDVTTPVITSCAAPLTLPAGANCSAPLPDLRSQVTATDDCPFTVTQSPLPGTILPRGMTTVTFTVADTSGNTTNCEAVVTVADITAPLITCPASFTAACTSTNGATVHFAASATDNCDVPLVNCTPISGSNFPVGTNTVICVASDSIGNNSSCSFTITVEDTTAAVLTITRNGGNVIITWPQSCTGYILEQANPLALPGPSSWSTVPEPVTKVGNNNQCSVPMGSANKFFRLRKP